MALDTHFQLNQSNDEDVDAGTSRRISLFWLSYLAIIVFIVALGIVILRVETEDLSGILIRDQDEWQHVAKLPVNPQAIAVGDSIWIVDDNNHLVRFERFNGSVWSWYQVQEDDTVKDLAETFHTTRLSIERRIDDLADEDEMPVGEWIWIEGYQTYSATDLGLASSAQINDLFAYSDLLWLTATQDENDILVYFDGQSWLHPDGIQFDGSIQAFSGTTIEHTQIVVVLDEGNTLYNIEHVDNISKTELSQVRHDLGLGPIAVNMPSSLVVTADGNIFILSDILLHFDGQEWSNVSLTDNLEGVDLSILGSANRSVWLADTEGRYLELGAEGRFWRSFTLEDMGISEGTAIYGVTGDETRALFATDSGILAFDGERWWIDYHPERDAPIRQVTFGKYNQVWAVTEGEETNTSTIYGALIATALAAVLLLIGMTVRGLPRLFGPFHFENRRSIIEQGINEKLPERNELKSAWEIGWRGFLVSFSPVLILGFVGLILVLVWRGDTIENLEELLEEISDAVENILPNAPAWLKEIIGEFLLASLLFILGLPFAAFAILRTKNPEKRARLRRNIIGAFVGLMVLSIFETLMKHLAEGFFDDPLLIAVVCVLLSVVIVGTLAVYFVFFGWLRGGAKSALGRGDYELALSGLEKSASAENANTHVLWTSGAMFVVAGRFVQAEEMLRQSIRKSEQSPIFASFAFQPLQHLGAALNGQGRYAEAKDALDAALNINKNSGYAQLRLAENYLLQNQWPELALNLLARAYKNRRAIFSPFGRVRYVEAEIWANRAWAYSLMRQFHEVDTAIENAFAKVSPDIVPLYGGILWRAGKAMQHQRNRSKARNYFHQSLSIDPKGAFAERARESLKELDDDFT